MAPEMKMYIENSLCFNWLFSNIISSFSLIYVSQLIIIPLTDAFADLQIDTKDILFICGGAFVDLEKTISER